MIPKNIGPITLSWAVQTGNEVVVKLLLNNGANKEMKEKRGGTPLTRALGNGSEAIIKLLLAKGAEVDMYSYIMSL